MELKVSAVFKIVEENGETVGKAKSEICYEVCDSKKKATKKELYESLKSKIETFGDMYRVEDLTKEELEEYKKQEEEDQ